MKYLILFLFGLATLFIGCADNNVVQPDLNTVSVKGRSLDIEDGDDIEIDEPTLPFLEINYSETLTIDGDVGGIVRVAYRWNIGPNAGRRLVCRLRFPPKSFKGVETFDIRFDLKRRCVLIYPSPLYLDRPVSMNLIFEGIDVSAYDPATTEFVYKSPSGEIIPTPYEDLIIDNELGSISVFGAKLNHFSRFGFVR